MNHFLLEPLHQLPEFGETIDAFNSNKTPILVSGPSDSQKAHFAAGVIDSLEKKAVFVTFNDLQAKRMVQDLQVFFGEQAIFLPSRELVMQDIMARSSEADCARLEVFAKVLAGEFRVIVTSVEGAFTKTISKRKLQDNILELKVGDELNYRKLAEKLIGSGYSRADIVEGKGQFAMRGDIIDVFSPAFSTAVRIELFGDEIDTIRLFDVESQRSLDNLEKVKIIPARELIFDSAEAEQFTVKISNDLEKAFEGKAFSGDGKKMLESRVNGDIDKLLRAEHFAGIDAYLQYICEDSRGIFDFLDSPLVIMDESVRIEQKMENMLLEHYENCKSLIAKGELMPAAIEQYISKAVAEKLLHGKNTMSINAIATAKMMQNAKKTISISCKQLGGYNGHFNLLAEDILVWRHAGKRICIMAGAKSRGVRLETTLRENNALATYVDSPKKLSDGRAVITKGALYKGFEYPSIGLIVIAGSEFTDAKEKKRRRQAKKVKSNAAHIASFTDLNPGDYIVHEVHGIGRYVGIEQVTVSGVTRDYVKLMYLENGALFIPTDQMSLIQKYIGQEGKKPKLNKLGGSDWQRLKSRVKESIMVLAAQLVELYAKRESIRGFKFSEDSVWQRQFEELFPYNETDDQLNAIEEIKSDMQKIRPMDRLLCGDVGFGKTEVAMRAVFKAVLDGKQVAYLCPTTVLAQQQYYSFKERMRDFPVAIDVVSRFKSKGEISQTLKKVPTGEIDVLIGTHRLLSADVKFKNLGLLVVDEEQRFGVKHKEKIKELYPDIDVLTLSATPIPRTLHMSLSGIRDISVLEQPPEERFPVQTYVMEYELSVITDAIYREIARGGQVFYLYNRVRTINIKAEELRKAMPDLTIEVAHGQMNERELEDKIQSFINGQIDVLLCTTIIESGIDMPNVNTMIVENAEMMGLSQLYQIRGRVGRSNRLAYAYITYKKNKILTEEAEKRLQAIKEFTEFGSGFKIAMRDMEIRGAGNLLGPEQHGHMETVGYEMYCKLLEEAVQELQNIPRPDKKKIDATIELGMSAYIDTSYVSSEQVRIDMYKKIASISCFEDTIDVRDELIDRFGEIPNETDMLIEVAYIKALAEASMIEAVSYLNGKLQIKYFDSNSINVEKMGAIITQYGKYVKIDASSKPSLTFSFGRERDLDILGKTVEILSTLSG